MTVATRAPRIDFDNAWKGVLSLFLRYFMAFFFPRAHQEIDWTKKPEFLDKELQYAVRRVGRGSRGKRAADILAKVWLLDGEESWILIHVEVQSQVATDFAERMYLYNTLLYERYRKPVVSIAVLGDTQPDWRPTEFQYGRWGATVHQSFMVAKLLDYKERINELKEDRNPFAIIVAAHLMTQATRRKPRTRLEWKKQILEWICQQGYNQDIFMELFRFIELVMPLTSEMQAEYMETLDRVKEEQTVPVITQTERIWLSRGEQQGRQEGQQEGRQEGRQEGIKWVRELLVAAIRERFGHSADRMQHSIEAISDPETLKLLNVQLIRSASLEDFEKALLAR